jgi:SOS response associated peptidase (SRAP)
MGTLVEQDTLSGFKITHWKGHHTVREADGITGVLAYCCPPFSTYAWAMCGRYGLNQHPAAILLQFHLGLFREFRPRYNIAPSQIVPLVCLNEARHREGALLRWRLIPFTQFAIAE